MTFYNKFDDLKDSVNDVMEDVKERYGRSNG